MILKNKKKAGLGR